MEKAKSRGRSSVTLCGKGLETQMQGVTGSDMSANSLSILVVHVAVASAEARGVVLAVVGAEALVGRSLSAVTGRGAEAWKHRRREKLAK